MGARQTHRGEVPLRAQAWAWTWRGTAFEIGHCRDLGAHTRAACLPLHFPQGGKLRISALASGEGWDGLLGCGPLGVGSGEASCTHHAGVAPGLGPDLAEVTGLHIGGWRVCPLICAFLGPSSFTCGRND